VHEEMNTLMFWLRKSRHVVETCGRKQRRISPVDRPRVDGCSGKGRAAHLVRH